MPIEGKSPTEALEIYRINHFSSLYETLKDTYEAIYKLLEEDLFSKIANNYIFKFPSKSFNLSDYGEFFPSFLNEMNSLDIPFLIDLAKLEWNIKEVLLGDKYEKGLVFKSAHPSA